MYQQRPLLADEAFESQGELWNPELTLADGTTVSVAPGPQDRYVVVDEMVDEVARLVEAAWPELDRGGRLHFPEDGSPVKRGYPRARLEDVLNEHRRRAGQVERSLRIGDAFLIRGFSTTPGRWEEVWDVTQASRPAAKAAFLRAVAPPLSEPRPRRRGVTRAAPASTGEGPVEPPPASAANPAV